MQRLTVLYDEACPICVRCRDWLAMQPAFVELELLGCGSAEARRRYGEVPWLREDLVVVSDEGAVWVGPAAFIVSLWALCEWREWSYRLSGASLAPLAERFFKMISKRRRALADFFPSRHDDCPDGTCRKRDRAAYR
jgi:predicted DCC family thiol-disulfide oxidoreductase YuxK